ncbi:MAG: hypothetical protein MUF83_04040 [Acidimicrobiales bacterium]|jgi:hypothetical protein|nr:hypothetical protein [Acidimicrobiales bacterium]
MLDSGAVVAPTRHDLRAAAPLAATREAGVEVSISSVVIAETVRGSAKDVSVNRVVKPVGEVTSADERGGGVLTGDPDDLEPLASGHPDVVIRDR